MQGSWGRSIPCWGKVAAACGKCGLGKVANIEWHKISAFEIKNTTIRSGSKNEKNLVKNRELARYQIAPIILEAEVTFTMWETSARTYDVFYCGMYEPGSLADRHIETLKSPPDLPAA